MEPPHPRCPDGDRRRKRRELDARRSKCRIRLGGHLEQWCRLKEQLGFALHSQLPGPAGVGVRGWAPLLLGRPQRR
uniref:ZNF692 n=1 Tax=Pavo cristatus TaxID=9049 RepID=A0A8C9F0D9_PAVCR